MTVSEDNPNDFLPGTWEKVEGRFLLGSGSISDYSSSGTATTYTYTNGSTGGEVNHKLIVDEMPGHNHTISFRQSKDSTGAPSHSSIVTQGYWWTEIPTNGYQMGPISAMASGGNQYHNNMPPYLVVNIWKRVS